MLHGQGEETYVTGVESHAEVSDDASCTLSRARGAPATVAVVGVDRQTRGVFSIDDNPGVGAARIEASERSSLDLVVNESSSDESPGAEPTGMPESHRGVGHVSGIAPGGRV